MKQRYENPKDQPDWSLDRVTQGPWRTIIWMILSTVCSCCLLLYFSFVSYPSTKSIARAYLLAIANEDLETAMRWVTESSGCYDLALESALKDVGQYGGSEIRNLSLEVYYNSGSDDEIQVAFVNFDYRKHDESEWQNGEMKIFTDHEVPGFRYTCGNMLSGQQ